VRQSRSRAPRSSGGLSGTVSSSVSFLERVEGRLLVTRPAVRVPPILLIRRQPVHAVLAQNAVHGRTSHRQAVKAIQIIGNLSWAELVVLSQIQNLADDVGRSGPGRVMRCPSSVGESAITVLGVALSPFVERLSRNPKVPCRCQIDHRLITAPVVMRRSSTSCRRRVRRTTSLTSSSLICSVVFSGRTVLLRSAPSQNQRLQETRCRIHRAFFAPIPRTSMSRF
jgi:hypothetical protein